MKKRITLLMAVFFLLSGFAFAQEKVVKGIVYDETGFPLPGANVVVRGTTIGVTTDIEGEFSIKAKNGDVLVVTFMGYEEFKQRVSKNYYKINLSPDAAILNDVVVTGFQTVSKERSAGAFESLDAGVLEVKPVQSVTSLLSGQMTGVDVKKNGIISIRGVSSFLNREPLVVVDGFPIEGGLESVNPNNIASVNVLKDASASSIWGARSANGVIVITTKKGSEDRVSVSFNSFVQMSEMIDLDYMNPIADAKTQLGLERYFAEVFNITNPRGILLPTNINRENAYVMPTKGSYLASMEQIGFLNSAVVDNAFRELENIDYKDDVYDYLLQRPIYQQYNLAIRGSSSRNTYSFSIMYDDERANSVGSDSKRVIVDFRDTYKFNDNITMSATMYSQYANRNDDGAGLSEIANLASYDRLVNPDGTYANQSKDLNFGMRGVLNDYNFPYKWDYNLLQEVRNRDITTDKLQNRIQFGIDFKIISGLSFSTKFQYERMKEEKRRFYGEETYYARKIINSASKLDQHTVSEVYYPKGGIINRNNFRTKDEFNFRNQLNYVVNFGKDNRNNFNIILGSEIIQNKTKQTFLPDIFGASKTKLATASLPDMNGWLPYSFLKGTPSSLFHKKNVSFMYNNRRFFSAYTNASYTFDSRYTATASVRVDASNMISDDPKYRYTPLWSVGANWNVKNEKFLESAENIDRLNLRVSYGVNAISSASSSDVTTISFYSGNIENDNNSYISSFKHGNPNLSWEKTKSYNVGIDYSFWDMKLFGSIEAYSKKGVDLFYTKIFPSTLGFGRMAVNYASILNQGVEVNVGTKIDFSKNVSLSSRLNYSFNDNTIIDIDDNDILVSEFKGDQSYIKDGRIGDYYAYQYDGYFNGVPYVKGTDGKRHAMTNPVPTTTNKEAKLLHNLGTTVAPHIAGWTNTLDVYDFSLTTVITARFGSVYRDRNVPYNSSGVIRQVNNYNRKLPDYLNNPAIADYPGGSLNATNVNQVMQMREYLPYLSSSVHDGSFIRFNDIILNYSFASLFRGKSVGKYIKGLSVYLTVSNVGLIWVANEDGTDPDYPLGNVKPQRSYTFGARINL